MTNIETLPENTPQLLREFDCLFGIAPVQTNYFSHLVTRMSQEARIEKLLRIKAMITMADVLEVCEQEAA